MADSFNAVDIVYGIISGSGVTTYRDKAPVGTQGEHVVINTTTGGPSSFATNDINLNVNIFIPAISNGVPNRARMKAIKDIIEGLISAATVEGYYCEIEDGFEQYLDDAKPGFDVLSLRKIVTLNR